MAENRVIGKDNHLPWRLPLDYRWFKHKTMGGTLIMGRKTYESIGQPLPGRSTVVVTRGAAPSGTVHCPDLADLERVVADLPGPHWIAGGVQIYTAMLPRCALLYLTRVKRHVDGDASFPEFEDQFEFNQLIHENDQFRVERWVNLRKDVSAQTQLAPESWPF